jgi:DNA-directed RNA polymerase subunit K/omega
MKKIEVQEYEDFMLEAGNDALTPADIADLRQELDSCHRKQRELFELMRVAIHRARNLSKENSKIAHLQQAVDAVNLALNIDFSANMGSDNLAPTQGEISGCQDGSGNCVKERTGPISQPIKSLVEDLAEIKTKHTDIAASCREYVVAAEEKKLLDQIQLIVNTVDADQSM